MAHTNEGETLKEKTTRGLFWGGMNNLIMQLVGVVFGIILGRLLNTDDWGMMSGLAVFSLVATALQNSGFSTALANLDHPTDRDYNSVFWFNIIVGFTAYAVLFFSAPLIAHYYHSDKYIPLCRYAFLSIPIASLGTVQNAYLFKNLKAKQQAKASMTAVIVSSSVASLMAFYGFAYWSLATQGIVYVLFNTLMAWHYSAWRPTRQIDFGPVRRMFRFSCKILATTITTQINNNILNILLPRYYGTAQAGLFSQAYQWDTKAFSLVQGMVNQVAQPILVDLRSEEERQLNALRKMMRFTAFISFPLLLGFGLVAKEFIVLAITAKWLPSAELIQMLCFAGAVTPLCTLLSNMVISKGQSGIYFGCTLALCLVEMGAMLLLVHQGVRTMVMAYTLINIAWVLVWHYFTWRLTHYRLLHFLSDTLPFALTALAVMAATWLLTSWITSLWGLLLSRIVTAAILYYAVMKLARVQILKECEEFIAKKLFS